MKQITFDYKTIRYNNSHKSRLAAIVVDDADSGSPVRVHAGHVDIVDADGDVVVSICSHPDGPTINGNHCWIETDLDIEVYDEHTDEFEDAEETETPS